MHNTKSTVHDEDDDDKVFCFFHLVNNAGFGWLPG